MHVRCMQYNRLLTPDYYRAAISILERSCTTPCFFIFSDDGVWCREQLSISYSYVYVDNFDDELYELQLMSFCHHFIIANSPFSWWWGRVYRNIRINDNSSGGLLGQQYGWTSDSNTAKNCNRSGFIDK